MRKNVLIVLVLVSVLVLAACGGSQTAGSSAAQATTVSGGQTVADGTPQPVADGARQFQMPEAMKLALGIFTLEDSATPVDAAQAAQLLPLWKAARSLAESDTTATAEIEAVLKQIRGTLTADQQQAIDSMQLTPENFTAIGEKYGFQMGFGNRGGNLDANMVATMEARRASGQTGSGGAGGGPGDGGGPPAGGFFVEGGGRPGGNFQAGGDPAAIQTQVAANGGQRGATLGLNTELLNAIITFLEGKVK